MFNWAKSPLRWVLPDTQASRDGSFTKPTLDGSNSRRNARQSTVGGRAIKASRRRGEQKPRKNPSTKDSIPDTIAVVEKEFSLSPNERIRSINRAAAFVVSKEMLSPESVERLDNDRQRMPPPLSGKVAPSAFRQSKGSIAGPASTFNGSVIARTLVSTGNRSMLAGIEDYEQAERIKRHSEALKIPPDSGIWYQSEAGLYFHLGLRCLEALLPPSWIVDFKTFPPVLFEFDLEADCLIRNIFGSQFHAIRALRELIETGNRVRDLLSAKHKMLRVQQSIQTSLDQYLEWALHDGDLYEIPASIPAYVIAQRRKGQPTVDAIAHLAENMAALLQRHCTFYETEQHPEFPPTPLSSADEPQPEIHDDSPGRNPPVVLGFLIVQTTISIFTLNASNAQAAADAEDEGRGIHMLGRFNFMESGQDVWNALALAICCCHLRNGLLAKAIVAEHLVNVLDSNAGEFTTDHGKVAGYISRKAYEVAKKRKHEEDSDLILEGFSTNSNGARKLIQPNMHGRKRLKRESLLPPSADSDPDL